MTLQKIILCLSLDCECKDTTSINHCASECLEGNAGIYIMQNTIVGGGGDGRLGKKLRFRGKIT